MKVAIIGSRTFNNYNKINTILSRIHSQRKITLIVSGGAKGADSLGEKWANENNIDTLVFLPDWKKHGKKAGFIRNVDIVENADFVIAFWDGASKGTQHSINLCMKFKKQYFVINP